MAAKRMIDRGVLSVLSFNQLNIYSSVESEDFSKPSSRAQPQTQVRQAQPQQVAPNRPQPQPQPPRPQPPVPRVVEKKTEKVDSPNSLELNRKLILEYLGASVGQLLARTAISEGTGLGSDDTVAAIKSLLHDRLIVKEGERRGSKYGVPQKESPSPVSFSEEQFNELWKDACGRMSRMGVSYRDIAGFTRE